MEVWAEAPRMRNKRKFSHVENIPNASVIDGISIDTIELVRGNKDRQPQSHTPYCVVLKGKIHDWFDSEYEYSPIHPGYNSQPDPRNAFRKIVEIFGLEPHATVDIQKDHYTLTFPIRGQGSVNVIETGRAEGDKERTIKGTLSPKLTALEEAGFLGKGMADSLWEKFHSGKFIRSTESQRSLP
jgi:hypothetical protein